MNIRVMSVENGRPDVEREYRAGDVTTGNFREVLAIENGYLNDHCLVQSGGEWHCFGIVGQRAAPGEQNEVSFAHASSFDLFNWKRHPDVLHCLMQWPEESHVIAPFVVQHNNAFVMLYGATDKRNTQCICLATSEDLFEWKRHANNPVIVPSLSWSKWPRFGLEEPDGGTFGSCRDPHVTRLDDGRFVAYWVSRLQEKFGSDMTCIAASVSTDLKHWQEIGPVFHRHAWHRGGTQELESPCVVFKDGSYWLFFKHGWGTECVSSECPFDFQHRKSTRLGYSHASEIFEWKGEWWITHCKTDPDDYDWRRSDLSRGLFLSKLEWPQGASPRLSGSF